MAAQQPLDTLVHLPTFQLTPPQGAEMVRLLYACSAG
jgi:hypothetical protein